VHEGPFHRGRGGSPPRTQISISLSLRRVWLCGPEGFCASLRRLRDAGRQPRRRPGQPTRSLVQPPRHDVRAPRGDQPEPHRGAEKKGDQVEATRQLGEDASVDPQSREADVTTEPSHYGAKNDREQAAHRPHGVDAGRQGESSDGGRNHDEGQEGGNTRRRDPCRQAGVSRAGVLLNSSSTHFARVTPPEELRQTPRQPVVPQRGPIRGRAGRRWLLLVLPTCSQEVTRSVVKKTVLFHRVGKVAPVAARRGVRALRTPLISLCATPPRRSGRCDRTRTSQSAPAVTARTPVGSGNDSGSKVAGVLAWLVRSPEVARDGCPGGMLCRNRRLRGPAG
jgi:hypothetical protein